MTCDVATCPRCGIRRYIHPTRSPNLCASCNLVQPVDEPGLALPPGQWVNHGLTKVFQPVNPQPTSLWKTTGTCPDNSERLGV